MRRRDLLAVGACAGAAALLAGCTGSATPSADRTSSSASSCHITAAHLRAPVRPDSTATPTIRLSGTLAAHIRSAWVDPEPSNIRLAAAGALGDVYFSDRDGLGRLAPGGRVRWSVSGGRTGLQLFPTAHNVVAVGSTGDVAVLDGMSGRLLACTSVHDPDPVVGKPVVIDDDDVAVGQVGAKVTRVARFSPGGAGGFRAIGRVPGQWAVLALSDDEAVLGGRIARMGPTGGAATRLNVVPVGGRATTSPSALSTLKPYSRPGPPAGGDAYGDPLGSAHAGFALSGPVAMPVLSASQGDWLGAEPVRAHGSDLVVQDVYSPYGSIGTNVGGGLAALDQHGRIRWRTAGAGRGQQVVADGIGLTGVVAGRRQLRVLTLDESTGRTRAEVTLPYDDVDPGIRSLVGAAGATWIRTDNRIFAVTPVGKQLTVSAVTTGELGGVDAAPSSTAAVVSTVRADNGANSYVVGP